MQVYIAKYFVPHSLALPSILAGDPATLNRNNSNFQLAVGLSQMQNNDKKPVQNVSIDIRYD